MKSLIALILASSLTACGDDSSQQAPAAASPQDASQAAERPSLASIALASAKELPPCTPAREAMLVYLRAEDSFQTCEGGDWIAINIDGQDGKQGAPGLPGSDGAPGPVGIAGADGAIGTSGDNGRDGIDGLDGEQGAAGDNGQDGKNVNLVWTDAAGTWLFMGWHQSNTAPYCYQLPTIAQVQAAIAAGLLTESGGIDAVYGSNGNSTYKVVHADGSVTASATNGSGIYGLYCIKQ